MPQPKQHASAAARQAAYRARQHEARAAEKRERGLPALPAVPTIPGTARWRAAVWQAQSLLETVAQEMHAWADARSDVWQESERAEEHESRIEQIEEAIAQLSDLDW